MPRPADDLDVAVGQQQIDEDAAVLARCPRSASWPSASSARSRRDSPRQHAREWQRRLDGEKHLSAAGEAFRRRRSPLRSAPATSSGEKRAARCHGRSRDGGEEATRAGHGVVLAHQFPDAPPPPKLPPPPENPIAAGRSRRPAPQEPPPVGRPSATTPRTMPPPYPRQGTPRPMRRSPRTIAIAIEPATSHARAPKDARTHGRPQQPAERRRMPPGDHDEEPGSASARPKLNARSTGPRQLLRHLAAAGGSLPPTTAMIRSTPASMLGREPVLAKCRCDVRPIRRAVTSVSVRLPDHSPHLDAHLAVVLCDQERCPVPCGRSSTSRRRAGSRLSKRRERGRARRAPRGVESDARALPGRRASLLPAQAASAGASVVRGLVTRAVSGGIGSRPSVPASRICAATPAAASASRRTSSKATTPSA